ncbi:ribosome biogenesis protein SLX9 homolog [Austrofundulus limnaeus]|uniref:Ribosome biogenesis protein SLX9 homolog n=1 Tax=Austrofundulus limnaeus TaxID=52670 RepID=A0A2I4CVE0_AUSLI|nr:PREDICTED: protein FAM207A [Austrofundulus limnaeus]
MVGKIKHVRQKLHQEAVKLGRPEDASQPGSAARLKPPALELQRKTPEEKVAEAPKQVAFQSSLPSSIFSGTKISPEALVQTLKLEEQPQVVLPSKKDPEEKKIKTKKEKMKERREKWLNKISFIKKAKEQQAAEARRQATPVVGDMRPLADALPELCQLIGPAAAPASSCRKSRKNKTPVKRPQPTDFSQMKGSQKRKLLETESSRFSDAVKMLASRKNPLLDIGEQLRKRMRQEEEQGSG